MKIQTKSTTPQTTSDHYSRLTSLNAESHELFRISDTANPGYNQGRLLNHANESQRLMSEILVEVLKLSTLSSSEKDAWDGIEFSLQQYSARVWLYSETMELSSDLKKKLGSLTASASHLARRIHSRIHPVSGAKSKRLRAPQQLEIAKAS